MQNTKTPSFTILCATILAELNSLFYECYFSCFCLVWSKSQDCTFYLRRKSQIWMQNRDEKQLNEKKQPQKNVNRRCSIEFVLLMRQVHVYTIIWITFFLYSTLGPTVLYIKLTEQFDLPLHPKEMNEYCCKWKARAL